MTYHKITAIPHHPPHISLVAERNVPHDIAGPWQLGNARTRMTQLCLALLYTARREPRPITRWHENPQECSTVQTEERRAELGAADDGKYTKPKT